MLKTLKVLFWRWNALLTDFRGRYWPAVGAVLIILAILPGMRPWLEGALTRHLLVQYPMLVAGGAMIGANLGRARSAPWLAGPALLLGSITVMFWALPRWLDAAAINPGAAGLGKIATLVLLAGLPLGWGWREAGPVLRAFTWANYSVMALIMGWLQLIVPSRLCNAYLITDQHQSGRILIMLALLSILMGCIRMFFAPSLPLRRE